jgi:hypothetical protein
MLKRVVLPQLALLERRERIYGDCHFMRGRIWPSVYQESGSVTKGQLWLVWVAYETTQDEESAAA